MLLYIPTAYVRMESVSKRLHSVRDYNHLSLMQKRIGGKPQIIRIARIYSMEVTVCKI